MDRIVFLLRSDLQEFDSSQRFMRYLLLVGFLLITVHSFSQSKKEQIEILENKVDSVAYVISELRDKEFQNRKAIEQHRKENEVLREIMKGYVVLIDELNTKNLRLEMENDSLKRVIENKVEEKKVDLKKRVSTNSTDDSFQNPFAAGGMGGPSTGPGLSSDSDSGSGGQANRSNNSSSQSSDPFSMTGTSDGCCGPGIGISDSPRRTRLNNVSIHNIEIKEDVTIYYKLIVDAGGNVVAFSHLKYNTTTTDMTLINKIGVAIKKQVKFNKAPGAPLVYQFYTIHIKAN
jgi:hypothetical protein